MPVDNYFEAEHVKHMQLFDTSPDFATVLKLAHLLQLHNAKSLLEGCNMKRQGHDVTLLIPLNFLPGASELKWCSFVHLHELVVYVSYDITDFFLQGVTA